MGVVVDIAQIVTAICAALGIAIAWVFSRESLRSAERLSREARIKDLRTELFDRCLMGAGCLAGIAEVFRMVVALGAMGSPVRWEYKAVLPEDWAQSARTIKGLQSVVGWAQELTDLCFVLRGLARAMNADLQDKSISTEFIDRLENQSRALARGVMGMIREPTTGRVRRDGAAAPIEVRTASVVQLLESMQIPLPEGAALSVDWERHREADAIGVFANELRQTMEVEDVLGYIDAFNISVHQTALLSLENQASDLRAQLSAWAEQVPGV